MIVSPKIWALNTAVSAYRKLQGTGEIRLPQIIPRTMFFKNVFVSFVLFWSKRWIIYKLVITIFESMDLIHTYLTKHTYWHIYK